MSDVKKKRTGLLENEITAPKEPFDITKAKIEPINVGLNEIQINKKNEKEKKYKMVRFPEELKDMIDEVKQIRGDKTFYETVENMYNFYLANAFTEEQKKSLKLLKAVKDNLK